MQLSAFKNCCDGDWGHGNFVSFSFRDEMVLTTKMASD